MSETTTESVPSRRTFLDALLGIGVVGWMASAVYPVLRYLTPIHEAASGGPVHLSDEEQSTVERDKFTIVRSGPTRIIVFDDGSEIRALNAKCTHEGCTVQYVPGDGVIWCACHNGKFDLTGRNISGPPPRPLARFDVTKDPDGKLIVSAEEKA